MNLATRPLRAALAACLITALAACSGGDVDEAPPPSEPSVKMVTVSVGVAAAQSMTYTDPGSPDGVTTVPIDEDGAMSVQVTVPVGTTVRVQANRPQPVLGASCWISDATDQLIFTEGTDSCAAVAE